MNFDNDFKSAWNNYSQHVSLQQLTRNALLLPWWSSSLFSLFQRNIKDFYDSIDKIVAKFNDYLLIEAHEVTKL